MPAAVLQMLEQFWLKDGRFVAGHDISIADVLMVTELDMLNVLAGATEVRISRTSLNLGGSLPVQSACCSPAKTSSKRTA